MNSDTIVGLLTGGGFLFLASVIVPFLSKKLNKGMEAADASQKAAQTSESFAKAAETLVAGADKQIQQARQELSAVQTTCNQCLDELAKLRTRDAKRDLALDAVHAALLEIVPLLNADGPATEMLRAAIRTVARARYDDAK